MEYVDEKSCNFFFRKFNSKGFSIKAEQPSWLLSHFQKVSSHYLDTKYEYKHSIKMEISLVHSQAFIDSRVQLGSQAKISYLMTF